LPDARLSDCLEDVRGGAVAVLEPEEAVWAVRDAGSLIGRVGDFGLGFTKPVCGGDGWILVLGAEPCAGVVVGLLAGFEVPLDASDALLGFFSGCFPVFFSGFLSGLFAGASFTWVRTGVVGVFGAGVLIFFGETLALVVVLAVEIAAGLEIVLAVVGMSALFTAAGFALPFVCPFEGPAVVFFSSTFEGFVVCFF
jgi:hypothetical protein